MIKQDRSRTILTKEQRQSFLEIPDDDWHLGTYFTLNENDLQIINKKRRPENRLGFALKLGIVSFSNYSMMTVNPISQKNILYVANQLSVAPGIFHKYFFRENTLWDHLSEIRNLYSYVIYNPDQYDVG